MKAIPIRAAQEISAKYDYDQVIVIARKVGEGGGEHVTTYGRDKTHCEVAAQCGDFLKFKVMGWVADGEKAGAISPTAIGQIGEAVVDGEKGAPRHTPCSDPWHEEK